MPSKVSEHILYLSVDAFFDTIRVALMKKYVAASRKTDANANATRLVAKENKSPLPLTDPRDAVPRAHRVVHRCRRSV